ncbi:MAG: tRNA preQ1(34) S-adenosylmethionine ribosyltransferase-isomerase QueA [Aestuariivita sp.]|nr:tRNA preQ1(34) S-adenosylmethionine ribosyltransferase-isomerase QueA [Aestuariivita sp.]
MDISNFDFDLPNDLIAVRPASPRSSARLLVASKDEIMDSQITDLLKFLRSGDRLVFNDTRVIPARLIGHRYRTSAGEIVSAKVSVTLFESQGGNEWKTFIKPLKRVRTGEVIVFTDQFSAEIREIKEGFALLKFNMSSETFNVELSKVGEMPLPPYIVSKRPADNFDKIDYQSVFARYSGALAAPTASLHFDKGLLTKLRRQGIKFSFVTLHVGGGTFAPVRESDVRKHKIHSEWGYVDGQAVSEIMETKEMGGRIIAVGTTALRLLETIMQDGEFRPWHGQTDIFIMPGFEFQITDALITNFHLPRSTLMMLISAFLGRERIMAIYQHAICQRYRFFSYGDACLLTPGGL